MPSQGGRAPRLAGGAAAAAAGPTRGVIGGTGENS
jgi:hypothetical protein